jgi:hypothetical protein
MCLAGIKLTEQAVLQYTCDSATRLGIAQALAAEAQRLVGLLSGLLAVEGVKQRAGPVVIGAVKALGLCCLQRPQLAPVLLPPLLTLAQQVCVWPWQWWWPDLCMRVLAECCIRVMYRGRGV